MASNEFQSGREKRIASVQRRFKRSRAGAVIQIFAGQLIGAALLIALAVYLVPDDLGIARRSGFIPLDWFLYGVAAVIGLWGFYVLPAIKPPRTGDADQPE